MDFERPIHGGPDVLVHPRELRLPDISIEEHEVNHREQEGPSNGDSEVSRSPGIAPAISGIAPGAQTWNND
jgi:hypothetical protein